MNDLIVLVADKSMQSTLQGALARHHSLEIRPTSVEFRQHPERDGGTRSNGSKLLAREFRRFQHALMMLNHEGSGTECTALELEANLDAELHKTWGDKAKSIVIDPELDIWMWGTDNTLAEGLHWPREELIRDWLETQGFEFDENQNPLHPKEDLEVLFPTCRLPRSASNYQRITRRISLQRCKDAAFLRLRFQLASWFPPAGHGNPI